MSRTPTQDLLAAEAGMMAAGLTLQTEAMAVLLAEMKALSALMSGAVPHEAVPEAEVDAATEAGFDNMPV